MYIDFPKLQIFYYLVIFKHNKTVSEKLNISLKRIKYAINRLEKIHATKLFQRKTKVNTLTYSLTNDGMLLFNNIKPLFEMFPLTKGCDSLQSQIKK